VCVCVCVCVLSLFMLICYLFFHSFWSVCLLVCYLYLTFCLSVCLLSVFFSPRLCLFLTWLLVCCFGQFVDLKTFHFNFVLVLKQTLVKPYFLFSFQALWCLLIPPTRHFGKMTFWQPDISSATQKRLCLPALN